MNTEENRMLKNAMKYELASSSWDDKEIEAIIQWVIR